MAPRCPQRARERVARGGDLRRVAGRHDVADLGGIVGEVEQRQVVVPDAGPIEQPGAEPVEQPLPVLSTDEDDREVGDLAGLDEW